MFIPGHLSLLAAKLSLCSSIATQFLYLVIWTRLIILPKAVTFLNDEN
jgi:hypothetical protein